MPPTNPINPVVNSNIKRIDPILLSNFVVDFGSGPQGFAEVILPIPHAEVLSYREGDEKEGTSRQIPGRIKYSHAIMRRGIIPANDLYVWWKTVQDGQPQRRDVIISVLDSKGMVQKRYKVTGAWPCKYQTSPLKATGNEVFIEEIELACERLDLDTN